MDATLLTRARRYCAAQERSTSDVHLKLRSWGANGDAAGPIIKRLVKDGFLNEQRFAEHYAVSKFRQKCWGRVKIRAALRAMEVEARIIANGLAAIDTAEYEKSLRSLMKKQLAREKSANKWEREQRVKRSLMAKGFEVDLVDAALG